MRTTCQNCWDEKQGNEPCPTCRDMSNEEWALYMAKEAYSLGRIDIAELERQIEKALTDPPIPPWHTPWAIGSLDTVYQ